METMNTIELRDENIYPDEIVLRSVLGKAYNAYELLSELFQLNGLTCEWRYYHDGKAWLCKIQKKSKTIIWMSAWKGFLMATIYLPLKHLEKLFLLDIDEEIKNKARLAKDIMKSRPCTFEIRETQILRDFEKVMKLKIECK